MTLRPYDPDQLDHLSLRLIDLCGRLRRMAEICREEDFRDLPLNDKKALEWIGNLEIWVQKAEASMDRHVTRNRGARLAQRIQTQKTRRGRK